MRRLVTAAAALLLLPWVMAGCGESPTVTVYKQGQYQGKPDTPPWANEQFKGDRAAWERTIRARTDGQNEYIRVSGN